MLSQADNDMITRVAPGSALGAVMRRFWMPACLSEQLPKPGGDPIRVRLLSEDLVAFRDEAGRVGVLDEFCCHRTASLLMGRVEDCGIRCIYHGWKFAVDGTILETPNVQDARIKARMKQPAYPTREAGGIVWCYMGPPDKMPELPIHPWMRVPEENRVITRVEMNCNFLQMLEASFDSSHVGILHQDAIRKMRSGETKTFGRDTVFPTADDAPRFEVEEADFGFYYAALRGTSAGPDKQYARITPFIMPFHTSTPDNGNPAGITQPIDDENSAWIIINWSETDQQNRAEVDAINGLTETNLPPGGWERQSKLHANKANRYMQDRAAMCRGESWSGLAGLTVQDAAMMISMGPIVDRRREHLTPADVAISRIRRIYRESVRRVAAGGDPIGLKVTTDLSRAAAVGGVIAKNERWQSLLPVAVKRFEPAT